MSEPLFVLNRECSRCPHGHFELVICEHGVGVGECVRCQAKAAATDLLSKLADCDRSVTAHPRVKDHEFLPVRGHPDDDECTYRSDGTDDTYCGLREADHAVLRSVEEGKT